MKSYVFAGEQDDNSERPLQSVRARRNAQLSVSPLPSRCLSTRSYTVMDGDSSEGTRFACSWRMDVWRDGRRTVDTMSTTPEPIGDAFQRAIDHWRRRRPEIEPLAERQFHPPPLTIAISREAGSGGRRIAVEIAARLQWPLYDRELVEQIAEDSGLSTEVVELVDERRANFIVETLEAFTGASTMGGAGYAHRLGQTLAAIGAHGECVIVGRGASAVLPRETTISIRVVAATNDRVAEYCHSHGVNQRSARTELQRLDRERAEFVRQYFHKEIDDPHLYDLIVNSSSFTDESCVELCLAAIGQKQSSLQS